MAKVKLYRVRANGRIVLQFTNGAAQSARHALPYIIEERNWDGREVVNQPNRREVNINLQSILNKAQSSLMHLVENFPTKNMPATEIRDRVVADIFCQEEVKANFSDTYIKFAHTHTNARTREIYDITLKRITEFDSRSLEFRDITTAWLERFEQFLSKTAKANARAIHFRNIRAVFAYARKHDLTDMHPFDKFAIKTEKTRHRDLTADELRALFSYAPPTERRNKHHSKPLDYAVKYLDAAKLMYMMRGINIVDFCRLTDADVDGGAIHYCRAKTGKWYHIKIEREMTEIMRKYKCGEKLVGQTESYHDHRNFAKDMNKALKVIAKSVGLHDISTYTLRHSYATIMYNDLHLSMEVISSCLGHEYGEKVTNIYVNKDQKEIDEANRKMIDFIFQQKTPPSMEV